MDNVNQMPITNEELSSQLTGLNKEGSLLSDKEKKKLILISSIVFVTIIIIIIILITTLNTKSNKKKVYEKLGEINCVYEVQSISVNTVLLSNEFKKGDSIFDMEIDGEKVKFTKEYRFKTPGLNSVKFILYSPISIDFMFKDVSDVKSIEMKSEKNLEIKSMISAFEDCLSLYEIKSVASVRTSNSFTLSSPRAIS